MNIFKLVVDAYNLSEEESKQLFQCNDKELVEILRGDQKPSQSRICYISEKYNISLELIMNSKQMNKNDQKVLKELTVMAQKTINDRAESFYNDLINHGIDFIQKDKLHEIYDMNDDSIIISNVIVRDNYALYNFVKRTGKKVKPGGFKLNPLRQYDKDIVIDSWETAENVVFSLYKNGILKDTDFRKLVLDVDLSALTKEEANVLLKKYLNGTIEFDPHKIIILINNGAYVEKLAYVTLNDGIVENHYEKDVFTTMMLKKYCEEVIQ